MSYFACWSSRPAVVRIFRILSQLLPMDQQQVLPPLLPLRSSQSWFLWFDLLQLGTRTVLITQNQHMNCSMNPLHDRTRIGWVGWIGPNNFCDTSEQSERLHCIIYVSCIILHFIPFTSSKSQWISVFLMRRTSTSRCSQKAFHPYPFCLLSASCLRGCKDTTTERGWVLEASSLHLSKHQLETWRSHGPSLWIILDQTYRSNLRKERGFNSKPC